MTLKSICFALVASMVRCGGGQTEVLMEISKQEAEDLVNLGFFTKLPGKVTATMSMNSLLFKGPEASECACAKELIKALKYLQEHCPESVGPMIQMIQLLLNSYQDKETLQCIIGVFSEVQAIAKENNPNFNLALNSLIKSIDSKKTT